MIETLYQVNDLAEAIKYNDRLVKENKELYKEIERLNNIIDNAIELTENILSTEDRGYYQLIFKEQLKVLKGEDKEILDKENK